MPASTPALDNLLDMARQAREQAYAPYSHFLMSAPPYSCPLR